MIKNVERVNKRFATDYKLPINIFCEPFFSDRIELLRFQENYIKFLKTVSRFPSEDDYFEYYNSIKDKMINFIKDSSAFKLLNEGSGLNLKNPYCTSTIYTPSNCDRTFYSIDMKKANFNAMKQYSMSKHIEKYNCEFVSPNCTWREFCSMFIDNEDDLDYFSNSKYFRQVVFGFNPKRIITYETSIILDIIDYIDSCDFIKNTNQVFRVNSDEVILDCELTDYAIDCIRHFVESKYPCIELRIEDFELKKISGCNAYIRESCCRDSIDFKCVDPLDMPFIYRAFWKEDIKDSDYYFMHDKRLAKLVNKPEIILP